MITRYHLHSFWTHRRQGTLTILRIGGWELPLLRLKGR
jgi:hypothetical protein